MYYLIAVTPCFIYLLLTINILRKEIYENRKNSKFSKISKK